MTLKIHRLQTFSDAIRRTFVQHFTRFQLTACSHGSFLCCSMRFSYKGFSDQKCTKCRFALPGPLTAFKFFEPSALDPRRLRRLASRLRRSETNLSDPILLFPIGTLDKPTHHIWSACLHPIRKYDRRRKMSKMGWFVVVRGHPRSFKIAPFDRAHISSYQPSAESMSLSGSISEI